MFEGEMQFHAYVWEKFLLRKWDSWSTGTSVERAAASPELYTRGDYIP